jgi:DNA helicase-2/ATP-dependent DNA helicase PcrA
MADLVANDPNKVDDLVDDEIYQCLNLAAPRSFFLYAGAGSGKTRSLVNAVDRIRKDARHDFLLNGKKIAVITYTNAACDEIKTRLDFDQLVEVSTIHSFAWSLIGGFNADIRAWLRVNLAKEIEELRILQAKGRASKASEIRAKSIASKTKRLAHIEEVQRFVYSPSGDLRGRDSLNHSEVISLTSYFLSTKPTLQKILVNAYPVLFIDESQDTNKYLMDAFLSVQKAESAKFTLGLFGDMMQRIYSDGKVGLSEAIPDDWAKPVKKMNHRCPQRVIRLINRIRSDADKQIQQGRTDKPEGMVRLFIVPSVRMAEGGLEAAVSVHMAEASNDGAWSTPGGYKTLILEHQMAARRMGFDAMFKALSSIPQINTSLLAGDVPALRLFSNEILPVVNAARAGDDFAVAGVLRRTSPLLRKHTLEIAGDKQFDLLKEAKAGVNALLELWGGGQSPSFQQVLDCVSETRLFSIPDALAVFVTSKPEEAEAMELKDSQIAPDIEEEADEEDITSKAWSEALATPFEQIEGYAKYVSDSSDFGTHQGVKGLEFPRVMVVISDEEARGFLFSYSKLFGAKEKSKTDIENEQGGLETTIDRTRRLFYVTCSRAEEGLAIIAYSENPAAVKATVLREKWFEEDEVVSWS